MLHLAEESLVLPQGWPSWALVVVAAVLVRVFYRRHWTSIRDVPGPFLASFSNLWQVWHIIQGHTEAETIELHKKHGMWIYLYLIMYPRTLVLLFRMLTDYQATLFALDPMKSVFLIRTRSDSFSMPKYPRYDNIHRLKLHLVLRLVWNRARGMQFLVSRIIDM